MSSTPLPPAGPTPPPTYPHTGGRVGHRFGAATIAVIIAVIVLVVAGVTAAVVVPGTSSRPLPSKPGSAGGLVATNPAAPSQPGATQPHAVTPHTLDPSPTTTYTLGASPAPFSPAPATLAPLATTTPGAPASPVSSTTAVNLGNGISITPAHGWSVANQPDDHTVLLTNSDSTVNFFVTVGKAQSTDVQQELMLDIKGLETNLTNVQLTGAQQMTTTGNNFPQAAGVNYTADVSTQQGTTALTGAFFELLNPSTGGSAFIDFAAASADALNSATHDGAAMLASMV